jgi:hypothetical protein
MASICAHHREPVYLVDFSLYKPPEELRVDLNVAQERGKQWSVSQHTVRVNTYTAPIHK